MKKTIDCSISLRDTNISKGIAICGMLMWHVFYCNNPYGIEYEPFVRFVGAIGDYCVSAFLLVSGYGLTIQFESVQDGGGRFVICRLLKLYSNFWFIFFILVAYGTVVMKMPVQVDGSIRHQLKLWLLELFAIRGQASYNDSWWFFSLIISLYILFPVLYWGFKKALLPTVLFVLLEQSLSLEFIDQSLQIYMPIFSVGMLWAMYKNKITFVLSKIPYLYLILMLCLFSFSIWRLLSLYNAGNLWYTAIRVYGCLSVGMMIFILSFLKGKKNPLALAASFLGKHATNIYIVHLMFSKYWYPNFFYSLPSPWLIFIILLLSSLLFSVIIEWLKNKTGYNSVSRKVIASIDNLMKRTHTIS